MSFAQPLLLFGLLAAAVPIIIHLIQKRRPREHKFAAIELLLRSVERVERRWRLRRFLLLAARVALIAALALAAAGPLLGEDGQQLAARAGPERLAIVLDGSLSMRATHDGSSAFVRARTAARSLIDALGPEDQAVLVLAGRRPQLLVERPTGSKAELLRALDNISPSYEHAELGDAVTRGAQALGTLAGPGPSGAARVVLLSDLAQHGLSAPADLTVPGSASRAALEVIDVLADVPAERRTNVAITAVDVQNVPGDAAHTLELRARVQSFAKEQPGASIPRDISLKTGERALVEASVEVVPGTIVDKVLRHAFERPGPTPVEVVMEADALVEDDLRYVTADVRRQVRALIVDGAPSGVPKEDEIYYLERALGAGASDQPPPRVITDDDLARADLSAFDVIFFAGVSAFTREDGAKLSDFANKGGGLFISVAEGMDLELYNAELGALLPRAFRLMRVTDSEKGGLGASGTVTLSKPALDHPVLELFAGDSLGGLLSAKTSAYAMLQPNAQRPMTTLLEFEDGQPALVEAEAGRGRVMVLTTSIDRDLSDLPIRPAFVPLLRQVLLYLGQALTKPDARRTLVGEARELIVPSGAQALRVLAPNGKETLWAASELTEGPVRFLATHQPGHYAVEATFAGGAGFETVKGEAFAVNVDTKESDLRPLSIEEATALLEGGATGTQVSMASALARARALGGHLGPDAIAGMLLILMTIAYLLESMLTAKRVGS